MKVQLMQEKPSVSLKLLSKIDDNGAAKSKNFSYYFFFDKRRAHHTFFSLSETIFIILINPKLLGSNM
jgi:hypothetical protein